MDRASALPAQRAPLLTQWAVALLVAAPVWGQSGEETETKNLSAREAGSRLFTEQIRPLFEAKCLACHTGVSQQGELNLSTREGLLKGGSSGPAIVPGNAKASLLYKRVTHEEQPAMPFQGKKLSEPDAGARCSVDRFGRPLRFTPIQRPSSLCRPSVTTRLGSGVHFRRAAL